MILRFRELGGVERIGDAQRFPLEEDERVRLSALVDAHLTPARGSFDALVRVDFVHDAPEEALHLGAGLDEARTEAEVVTRKFLPFAPLVFVFLSDGEDDGQHGGLRRDGFFGDRFFRRGFFGDGFLCRGLFRDGLLDGSGRGFFGGFGESLRRGFFRGVGGFLLLDEQDDVCHRERGAGDAQRDDRAHLPDGNGEQGERGKRESVQPRIPFSALFSGGFRGGGFFRGGFFFAAGGGVAARGAARGRAFGSGSAAALFAAHERHCQKDEFDDEQSAERCDQPDHRIDGFFEHPGEQELIRAARCPFVVVCIFEINVRGARADARGDDGDVAAVYRYRDAGNTHRDGIETGERERHDLAGEIFGARALSALAEGGRRELHAAYGELHRRAAAEAVLRFRDGYGERVAARFDGSRAAVPDRAAVRRAAVQIADFAAERAGNLGNVCGAAVRPARQRDGRGDRRLRNGIGAGNERDVKVFRAAHLRRDGVCAGIRARLARERDGDVLPVGFAFEDIGQRRFRFAVDGLFVFRGDRDRRLVHHDDRLRVRKQIVRVVIRDRERVPAFAPVAEFAVLTFADGEVYLLSADVRVVRFDRRLGSAVLHCAVVGVFGDLPDDLHAARRHREVRRERVSAFAAFKYIVGAVRREYRLHRLFLHDVCTAFADREGDRNAVCADGKFARYREAADAAVVYEGAACKGHAAHVVGALPYHERDRAGVQRIVVFRSFRIRADIVAARSRGRFMRPQRAVRRPFVAADRHLFAFVGDEPELRRVLNGNAAGGCAPVRDVQVFRCEGAEHGFFRGCALYRPDEREGIRAAVFPAVIVVCIRRERDGDFVAACLCFRNFRCGVKACVPLYRAVDLRGVRRAVVDRSCRREYVCAQLHARHHIALADGGSDVIVAAFRHRDRDGVGARLHIRRYLRIAVRRAVVCRARVGEHEVRQDVFGEGVYAGNNAFDVLRGDARRARSAHAAVHDAFGHGDLVYRDRGGGDDKFAGHDIGDGEVCKRVVIARGEGDGVRSRVHRLLFNDEGDAVPAVFEREVCDVCIVCGDEVIGACLGGKLRCLPGVNGTLIADGDGHLHLVDVVGFGCAFRSAERVVAAAAIALGEARDGEGIAALAVIGESHFFQSEGNHAAVDRLVPCEDGSALIFSVEGEVLLLRPADVRNSERGDADGCGNLCAPRAVFKDIVGACRGEGDGDGLLPVGDVRRAAAVLRGDDVAVKPLGERARISRVLQLPVVGIGVLCLIELYAAHVVGGFGDLPDERDIRYAIRPAVIVRVFEVELKGISSDALCRHGGISVYDAVARRHLGNAHREVIEAAEHLIIEAPIGKACRAVNGGHSLRAAAAQRGKGERLLVDLPRKLHGVGAALVRPHEVERVGKGYGSGVIARVDGAVAGDRHQSDRPEGGIVKFDLPEKPFGSIGARGAAFVGKTPIIALHGLLHFFRIDGELGIARVCTVARFALHERADDIPPRVRRTDGHREGKVAVRPFSPISIGVGNAFGGVVEEGIRNDDDRRAAVCRALVYREGDGVSVRPAAVRYGNGDVVHVGIDGEGDPAQIRVGERARPRIVGGVDQLDIHIVIADLAGLGNGSPRLVEIEAGGRVVEAHEQRIVTANEVFGLLFVVEGDARVLPGDIEQVLCYHDRVDAFDARIIVFGIGDGRLHIVSAGGGRRVEEGCGGIYLVKAILIGVVGILHVAEGGTRLAGRGKEGIIYAEIVSLILPACVRVFLLPAVWRALDGDFKGTVSGLVVGRRDHEVDGVDAFFGAVPILDVGEADDGFTFGEVALPFFARHDGEQPLRRVAFAPCTRKQLCFALMHAVGAEIMGLAVIFDGEAFFLLYRDLCDGDDKFIAARAAKGIVAVFVEDKCGVCLGKGDDHIVGARIGGNDARAHRGERAVFLFPIGVHPFERVIVDRIRSDGERGRIVLAVRRARVSDAVCRYGNFEVALRDGEGAARTCKEGYDIARGENAAVYGVDRIVEQPVAARGDGGDPRRVAADVARAACIGEDGKVDIVAFHELQGRVAVGVARILPGQAGGRIAVSARAVSRGNGDCAAVDVIGMLPQAFFGKGVVAGGCVAFAKARDREGVARREVVGKVDVAEHQPYGLACAERRIFCIHAALLIFAVVGETLLRRPDDGDGSCAVFIGLPEHARRDVDRRRKAVARRRFVVGACDHKLCPPCAAVGDVRDTRHKVTFRTGNFAVRTVLDGEDEAVIRVVVYDNFYAVFASTDQVCANQLDNERLISERGGIRVVEADGRRPAVCCLCNGVFGAECSAELIVAALFGISKCKRDGVVAGGLRGDGRIAVFIARFPCCGVDGAVPALVLQFVRDHIAAGASVDFGGIALLRAVVNIAVVRGRNGCPDRAAYDLVDTVAVNRIIVAVVSVLPDEGDVIIAAQRSGDGADDMIGTDIDGFFAVFKIEGEDLRHRCTVFLEDIVGAFANERVPRQLVKRVAVDRLPIDDADGDGARGDGEAVVEGRIVDGIIAEDGARQRHGNIVAADGAARAARRVADCRKYGRVCGEKIFLCIAILPAGGGVSLPDDGARLGAVDGGSLVGREGEGRLRDGIVRLYRAAAVRRAIVGVADGRFDGVGVDVDGMSPCAVIGIGQGEILVIEDAFKGDGRILRLAVDRGIVAPQRVGELFRDDGVCVALLSVKGVIPHIRAVRKGDDDVVGAHVDGLRLPH